MINFRDTSLIPIWQKIQLGERLSGDDARVLFRTPDIISLGKMAHTVQKQKSGDAVYFVINQKIEPTNICVLTCKFCDFATKAGQPDAYEMTIQHILDKLTPDIHEVHITGGLHPTWSWEYYLDMLRQIRKNFPSVNIKAFTAVEIDFFHKKFKLSILEVLRQLKEAGLQTMPGGGAEVFSERIRKKLFSSKIGEKRWLEIHQAAHRMGIPTNSTILYGHIETVDERIGHLIKLREAQDQTGGFLTFIPLAFQPGETGIKPTNRFTSAIDDLRMIALSRLMLDNIQHIKAYWVMLTEEVASVALNFGADDMDGTVGGEKIAHDAGALGPDQLAKDQLIRIIKDAGKIPVERDAYYHPLNIYASHVIGKIPYLNSVPYFHNIDKKQFKLLPITPRRMGILARKGQIDAGLFSLVDYLKQRSEFEMLNLGISSRDQVKSVLLLSNYGWKDLHGKTIGIIDDTATSILLLKVLLEKKFNVTAQFKRMTAGVNSYEQYDAVLLIGDEALKARKKKIGNFEIVYDLASEWYQWQMLPFVFAVWAVKKGLPDEERKEIHSLLLESLEKGESQYPEICRLPANEIHYTIDEAVEFLEGFTYRLGERELQALNVFESLLETVEIERLN
ncbi:MAG: aminofutalosine synthase MqnE [bacterium]